MPDFPNPYGEETGKKSIGETERRLAGYIAQFLALAAIHVTPDEEEALAKVAGVFLRSFPSVKSDLEKILKDSP